MKKRIIFLSFILTGLPVIAAGNYTYSNLGPDQVYSNANMKYSVTAKSSPAASSFEDSMFLQSMLYGASLATGRLNILATPSIRTARAGLIGNFIDPYIDNVNNLEYFIFILKKTNAIQPINDVSIATINHIIYMSNIFSIKIAVTPKPTIVF